MTIPCMKPCAGCPFKKESAPGWIGDHENVQEIINIVRFERFFPCHMEVTKLTERDVSFVKAVDLAPFCTGALQFMKNSLQRSSDPATQKLVDEAGKNDEVFQWAFEMHDHHDRFKVAKGGKAEK